MIRGGVAVRTSDARHDRRFEEAPSIVQSGIREAMCVPMQGRYELMGVIYVDTTTPSTDALRFPGGSRFNEETLKLLMAIGRQSALAVETNRFQQALVEAERLAAVGQAVALLSHHIKNILQGMKGGSHLVKMGIDSENDDLIHKGWGILERNQDRIFNLCMDMLAFGKERRPKLEQGQVNEIVQEVIELMQRRADDLQIEIRPHFSSEIPPSLFDREGIQPGDLKHRDQCARRTAWGGERCHRDLDSLRSCHRSSQHRDRRQRSRNRPGGTGQIVQPVRVIQRLSRNRDRPCRQPEDSARARWRNYGPQSSELGSHFYSVLASAS